MTKLFCDPQGNCQPLTPFLEGIIRDEPNVFKSVTVDEYHEGWLYIEGTYAPPPEVKEQPYVEPKYIRLERLKSAYLGALLRGDTANLESIKAAVAVNTIK